MPNAKLVSLALLVVSALCRAVQGGDSVIYLGPVLSTGDSGKAVNSSGTVAFTESTNVYLYSGGVVTPVSGVAANNGPLSMNDAGDLAGSNGLTGFFYKNGNLQTFGTLYTFAQGINNSDIVVGDQYNNGANAYRAFIWQSGVLSPLPGPVDGGYNTNDESDAYAINNKGQIAGSYNNAQANGSAMVWSPSLTATLLATPAGYARSEAYGLNNNGELVGYAADQNLETLRAAVWANGQPTLLTSPAGNFGYVVANGVNDNGEIVGTASLNSSTAGEAVAWINGSPVALNSLLQAGSEWNLTSATAVNDAGEITGAGYYDGNEASFALIPQSVPEPDGLSLFAIVAIAGASLSLRMRNRPETCHGGR